MLNLGKLAVAILESKISDVIGNDAIKEIKRPLLETDLRNQILTVSKNAEQQWLAECKDKEVRDAIKQMPLAELESTQRAIRNLYDNPSSSITSQTLENQFLNILPKSFDSSRINAALALYLDCLRKNLIAIDGLRDKLNSLANIESAHNSGQIVHELREIRNLLKEVIKSETPSEKIQLKIPNESPTQLAVDTNLYIHVKEEVEKIWQTAEQAMKAGDNIQNVLDIYQKAIDIVVIEREKHPASLMLVGLYNDARGRYSSFRQASEIKQTADATEDYRKILNQLICSNQDYIQVNSSVMSIDDAIDHYVTEAQIFANNKTQEYISIAERYLAENSPFAAESTIERCKSLFLLGNEAQVRIERYRETRLHPILLARQKANELIQQAARSTDIQQGRNLLEKAMSIDPTNPSIQEVKDIMEQRISKIK